MSVFVSSFFSPASPRRPPNFIVIKYFLLGLLISNSIESILIIPKILDVLDQNKMQHKELEESNIKRQELKELVHEAESEAKESDRETERELRRMEVLQANRLLGAVSKSDQQELEHLETKHGKNPRQKSGHEMTKNGSTTKHPVVRAKPQKKDTGTNPVAVFMLFYGSTTLCLGVGAIFYEKVLLITVLIGVSCLGTVTLISANFSLLLILSVAKDVLIAGLSFKYRQMIVESEDPVAASMAAGQGMAGVAGQIPVQQQQPGMDYTMAGQVDPMATDPMLQQGQGQQGQW